MKCTKCGTEFEGIFCPNCGTPNDNAQIREQFCARCGTKFKGYFCPACGMKAGVVGKPIKDIAAINADSEKAEKTAEPRPAPMPQPHAAENEELRPAPLPQPHSAENEEPRPAPMPQPKPAQAEELPDERPLTAGKPASDGIPEGLQSAYAALEKKKKQPPITIILSPGAYAALKAICRWACAVFALIFGIISITTLAAGALTFLWQTSMTGYEWIAASGKGSLGSINIPGYGTMRVEMEGTGYPITILVFGILAFLAGLAHVVMNIVEHRREVAYVAFGEVKMHTLLTLADIVAILGGMIAACAADGWLKSSTFGLMNSGAAILCPLIFGVLFFAFSLFILTVMAFKKFSYSDKLVHINTGRIKNACNWQTLPESFITKKNVQAAKECNSEHPLRLSALIITAAFAAATLAYSLVYIIQEVSRPIKNGTAGAEDYALFLPAIVTVILLIVCFLLIAYKRYSNQTSFRKMKCTFAAMIILCVINAISLATGIIVAAGGFVTGVAIAFAVLSGLALFIPFAAIFIEADLIGAVKRNTVPFDVNAKQRLNVFGIGEVWDNLEKCNNYIYFSKKSSIKENLDAAVYR